MVGLSCSNLAPHTEIRDELQEKQPWLWAYPVPSVESASMLGNVASAVSIVGTGVSASASPVRTLGSAMSQV